MYIEKYLTFLMFIRNSCSLQMWRGTLARTRVKKTRAGLLILKSYREYKTRVYVNNLMHLFRSGNFDISLQIFEPNLNFYHWVLFIFCHKCWQKLFGISVTKIDQ